MVIAIKMRTRDLFNMKLCKHPHCSKITFNLLTESPLIKRHVRNPFKNNLDTIIYEKKKIKNPSLTVH